MGLKCLIIENDWTGREVLKDYLSDYADGLVACNGHEAIRVFAEALETSDPYNLVVLDITIQSPDRHELLAALRHIERERGIPGSGTFNVIFVTPLSEAENILWVLRTGREGFVFRPVERTALRREIARLGLLDGLCSEVS